MSTASAAAEVDFVMSGPERAFRISPVVADGAVFRSAMTTGSWVTGPDGQPCAGALGILLDDVLGYPVVHARPAGHWATSTEISVDFCAPVPADGSQLRAEGQVVCVGPSGGLTQARVLDAAGAIVAAGKQRLRFIPGTPAALTAGAGQPAGRQPDSGQPDSGQPPGVASTLDQLGAELTVTDDGAILTLPLGAPVSNPMSTLHGGIMFCASELAGYAALQRPGSRLATASVTISYLRPGAVTGQVAFEAVTLHRGRSLAVAQVVSRNAAGKTSTHATVTCHRAD